MRDELVASWVSRRGVPYIMVDGEVDISTAPLLDAVLCEARTNDPFSLIVSLEKCMYCDSKGLSVLLRHARETPQFIVVSVNGTQVRGLLRASGVDAMFEVVDSSDDALALCPPAST